jgi:hypothetical protein
MTDIEKFVQKIMELQEESRERPFTGRELEEIARELGMSDEDLAGIRETAANHRVRGGGYLRHGLWTDAVKEYEQALVLLPDDTEILCGLTEAHAKLFLERREASEKAKARAFAARCLDIKPDHNRALDLLRRIEKGKPADRGPLLVAGAILAVGLALVLTILFLVKTESRQPMRVDQRAAQPLPAQPAPGPATPTPVPVPAETNPNLGLPVVFGRNDKSGGLDFRPERSKYTKFAGSYAVTMSADVEVRGVEVEELVMKFELIGPDGEPLVVDSEEIWAAYQPVARSGDVIPLDYHKYLKADVFPEYREVRVYVESATKRAAPGDYELSPKLEFDWPNKPFNFELEIRERLSTVGQGYLGTPEDMTHRLVLGLTNTGRLPIEKLSLRIDYLDRDGKPITSKRSIVNLDSYPRFKVGQTRVYGTFERIRNTDRETFGGYRVAISEIE